MDDLCGTGERSEKRNHRLHHHRAHLIRDSGKHDERFLPLAEMHAGGGTERIRDDRCRAREERLLLCGRTPGHVPPLQKRLDMRPDNRVAHQIRLKEPADGLLGDVIVRGAESACDDHRIAAPPGTLECAEDLLCGVAHRGHPSHADADPIELLRDEGLVGIDDLADQQLVADGDDLGRHLILPPRHQGTKMRRREDRRGTKVFRVVAAKLLLTPRPLGVLVPWWFAFMG